MAVFKVWSDGWNGKDSPHDVEAMDANEAAERWVERNHGNFDYCDDHEAYVMEAGGKVRRFTVFVESHPVFTAKEESPEEAQNS